MRLHSTRHMLSTSRSDPSLDSHVGRATRDIKRRRGPTSQHSPSCKETTARRSSAGELTAARRRPGPPAPQPRRLVQAEHSRESVLWELCRWCRRGRALSGAVCGGLIPWPGGVLSSPADRLHAKFAGMLQTHPVVCVIGLLAPEHSHARPAAQCTSLEALGARPGCWAGPALPAHREPLLKDTVGTMQLHHQRNRPVTAKSANTEGEAASAQRGCGSHSRVYRDGKLSPATPRSDWSVSWLLYPVTKCMQTLNRW